MRSRKIKAGLIVFALLLINIFTVQAQGSGECGDLADPDATCPLDTWVFVLVFAALIFAAFHLYTRRKKQQTI